MKFLESRHIEKLSDAYVFDDFVCLSQVNLRIEHKDNPAIHIMWSYSIRNRTGYISSIEWIWYGHELMILFLTEMYASKVSHITLDARAKDENEKSQIQLLDFYRRFGFSVVWSSLSWDGMSMRWVEWSLVERQIQKYIQSIIIPQT